MAAVETYFPKDYPTNRYLEAFELTQVLTGFVSALEASKPGFTLRQFLLRLRFFHLHTWQVQMKINHLTHQIHHLLGKPDHL